MPKVRLTKSELKAQRDALKRFTRYLPTLQLKKQQLQIEARKVREQFAALEREEHAYREQLDVWVAVVNQEGADELASLVAVEEFRTGVRNIAGIDTPTFEELRFRISDYDRFAMPQWFDPAIEAVRRVLEFRLRRQILEEQLRLLETELRITTQRVNLFEKVKIPEARGNIRRIQIYLGDQQANAVGRAKIAKAKCAARDAAMAVGQS